MAGVRQHLERLATSGEVTTPRPAVEVSRVPAESRQRRGKMSSRVWLMVAAAVLIPLALLFLHAWSLSRLDINDSVVAESRRRVLQAVVPTLPAVAKEARCDPARLRSFVETVTGDAADEWDRLKKPVSGRDLVDALANSPLRDVPIERVSVKIRARDVEL